MNKFVGNQKDGSERNGKREEYDAMLKWCVGNGWVIGRVCGWCEMGDEGMGVYVTKKENFTQCHTKCKKNGLKFENINTKCV